MAVKFVRTCDRCGKVIREGNADSALTVGEGNSLSFYKKDEHKTYDICDECAEAFEKFMTGWVIPGLIDKYLECIENGSTPKPNTADFYSKEYKKRRTIEDVHEFFGVARPENTLNAHAWSDEVLSLCPEAKEGYDADAVKKALEEYSDTAEEKVNAHAYHKWTEEEDAFLIEERDRKVKTPKMAEKLGLSLSQVRSRIKYLDKLRKEKENVKNESDGWSDEVLEMARKHNEQSTTASVDSEPIAQEPSKDKTKIKLAPGTHTYHHWTAEEDRAIIRSSGKTLNDLACQFGTTIAAVRARKLLVLNGKIDINRED